MRALRASAQCLLHRAEDGCAGEGERSAFFEDVLRPGMGILLAPALLTTPSRPSLSESPSRSQGASLSEMAWERPADSLPLRVALHSHSNSTARAREAILTGEESRASVMPMPAAECGSFCPAHPGDLVEMARWPCMGKTSLRTALALERVGRAQAPTPTVRPWQRLLLGEGTVMGPLARLQIRLPFIPSHPRRPRLPATPFARPEQPTGPDRRPPAWPRARSGFFVKMCAPAAPQTAVLSPLPASTSAPRLRRTLYGAKLFAPPGGEIAHSDVHRCPP